jgi:hypothetical protein
MKHSVDLILDDDQLIELHRILLDEDAAAALDFLKRHLRSRVATLLDGRKKVKINRPAPDAREAGDLPSLK